MLSVKNGSRHATATGVVVRVPKAGLPEFLGGDLEFQDRGNALEARVDRVVPGEILRAVIRTREGTISPADVTMTYDPQPWFNPRTLWWYVPPLVLVFGIYLWSNYRPLLAGLFRLR